MAGETALARKNADERRTQAARRDEAERALLKAGLSIVAEQGVERLTLTRVGEAAGYSRGLPAHYFGTRERFIAALAGHIVREFSRGAARAEKHPPGLERLLGVCALYFDGALHMPKTTGALFAVLAEAATNPKLRKDIGAVNDRSIKAIEVDIRAAIAAGDIRADIDVRATAALILAGLRGAVGQWLSDPENFDLNVLRAAFLSNLERSLRP